MKKVTLLLVSFMMIAFISACSDDDAVSVTLGEVATTTRTVSSFTNIEISHNIEAEITFGTTESVIVETNSGLQEYLHTETNGNTLKIYFDDKVSNKSDANICVVHITMKKLNDLKQTGASIVEFMNNCTATDLQINQYGASNFIGKDIQGVNIQINQYGASNFICSKLLASYLKYNAAGASTCEIQSGGSTTLDLKNLIGASKFQSLAFIADKVSADLSGASEAEVTVTNEFDVKATGSSVFKYKGTPTKTNSNASGGSEIYRIQE